MPEHAGYGAQSRARYLAQQHCAQASLAAEAHAVTQVQRWQVLVHLQGYVVGHIDQLASQEALEEENTAGYCATRREM
jgi:hypothetical protein